MRIVEAPVHVSVTVHVDPHDVYLGLNSNDEATLNYICQMIAVTHSSDLREELLARLGVTFDAANGDTPCFDPKAWQDDDYLPEGTPEAEAA